MTKENLESLEGEFRAEPGVILGKEVGCQIQVAFEGEGKTRVRFLIGKGQQTGNPHEESNKSSEDDGLIY